MRQGSDNGPKHPKKTNVVSIIIYNKLRKMSFATQTNFAQGVHVTKLTSVGKIR